MHVPGPLAVDATYIYWADQSGSGAAIERVPKSGGASFRVTLDHVAGTQNHTGVAGLAVDDHGVYWSTYDLDGGNSMLWAYDFATGGNRGLGVAPIRALVLDAGTLYYSNTDGLWKIATRGDGQQRLAVLPAGNLAIDAWHIFVAANGSLYRVDRATSAVETLATGFTSNIAVAVDFNTAYVADTIGQVWAVDAPGHARRLFLVDSTTATTNPWVQVVGNQVYWSGPYHELMRMTTSGNVELGYFNGITPTSAIVDGDRLFFSSNDEVDAVCSR